jgi:hypothetical protein
MEESAPTGDNVSEQDGCGAELRMGGQFLLRLRD